MTTKFKTLEQVAQAMLNKYGFFVIYNHSPLQIGRVYDLPLGAGMFRKHFNGEKIRGAQYKIVSEATTDDMAAQHVVAGRDPDMVRRGGYMYRAVAE